MLPLRLNGLIAGFIRRWLRRPEDGLPTEMRYFIETPMSARFSSYKASTLVRTFVKFY